MHTSVVDIPTSVSSVDVLRVHHRAGRDRPAWRARHEGTTLGTFDTEEVGDGAFTASKFGNANPNCEIP